MVLNLSAWQQGMILAATAIAVPSGAKANIPLVGLVDSVSNLGIGTPISVHNCLHYKQEADRLYADYRVALREGGGHLSLSNRDTFYARYRSLAVRMNQWLAYEYPRANYADNGLPLKTVTASTGSIPIPCTQWVPLPPR